MSSEYFFTLQFKVPCHLANKVSPGTLAIIEDTIKTVYALPCVVASKGKADITRRGNLVTVWLMMRIMGENRKDAEDNFKIDFGLANNAGYTLPELDVREA